MLNQVVSFSAILYLLITCHAVRLHFECKSSFLLLLFLLPSLPLTFTFFLSLSLATILTQYLTLPN